MNAFFQFGWRVGVASSALWVIYFAFQQGIASLYGVTAEKALLGKLRTSPAIWVSSEVLSGSPDF
ncbi:hypothetical protein BC354_17770 [Vibrio cholerae]|nr:hypothetical protein BC354_17770 [Vibrio cholerae]RGP93228.1 hypothetical protein BC352_17180 [Vibrio cholerae]